MVSVGFAATKATAEKQEKKVGKRANGRMERSGRRPAVKGGTKVRTIYCGVEPWTMLFVPVAMFYSNHVVFPQLTIRLATHS